MTQGDEWDRYPAGISGSQDDARKAANRRAPQVAKAWSIDVGKLQLEIRRLGGRFMWRINRKPSQPPAR